MRRLEEEQRLERERLEKEQQEQEEKERHEQQERAERERQEAVRKHNLNKERFSDASTESSVEQSPTPSPDTLTSISMEEQLQEAERIHKEEQRRLRKEHKRALKKRAQSERLSAPVKPPPPPPTIPTSAPDLRREKMLQNVRQRVSSESVNTVTSASNSTPPAPTESAPLPPPQRHKHRVSSMILDSDVANANHNNSDGSTPTTPITPLTASLRDIVIPPSDSSSRSTTPHSGHSTPRKPVSRSGTDTDLAGRVVMNNMASPERRGRRHERARTSYDISADMETPPRLCSPAHVGAAGGAAGGKRLVSTPAGVGSAPSTPGMGPGSGPYADYSPPVPPKDSPFDRSTYFDRSISPTKNRAGSPSGRVSSLSAVEISNKLKKFAGKIVPSSPPKRGAEFESPSRSMSPVKDRVASSPNPGRPMSALSGHSDTSRSSSPVDSIMSHSRSSTMMTSSSGSSGNSMLSGFIPNMSMPSMPNVKLPRASSPLKNPLSAKDLQHTPVEPAPPRILHGTGKGPRTFEEMGINPVTKEADDCVIM
ncbi:uncharacterized protein YALI1_C10787g [Yarrowia lipolytica]|uniref:Uncharacterized protein n=1 Tax=Yarrowia lipolytica TaxID=4952 RepID=A0A1D8NA51_YARLL|nr:hypothetical protein YALI1_C10787g [Yarrowia lipolytica]